MKRSFLVQTAVTKPRLIIVLVMMLTVLGVLSLALLPKDLLPAANLPAVQILSFYSGMPVEDTAMNLSARFERSTGQAIGIKSQDSKSLMGVSIVRNFFGPETDLNTAMSLTTSLVMSTLRRLPPGAQPPMILPFDPMAATPLALVAVSGDFPENQLNDTANYQVRNAVQSVTGAMAPTVMGGAQRQVVVFLERKKLDQFNLSPLRVIDKLTDLNTFVPSGDIRIDKQDYPIISNGLADHISDMDDFPLRYENGIPVFLHDVGMAQDASAVQTTAVRIDGKRQVYVPLYRQPGANSIQVVDDVRAEMKRMESRLQGYTLRVVSDQSIFIRHAIHSITEEAVLGGGLAALMVFLFLGNLRATAGILLSLPISILCAFLGLKSSGQTINAMTLGGLALSIGVLVDNSIVVLENIIKKLDHGSHAYEAALGGASEVAVPVLASTLATLVVFFPVVFLSGIVKVLFSALAKAVIFAMIGSYLTAMTVVPLFSSRFLKPHDESKGHTGIPLLLDKLTEVYGRALSKALNLKKVILAGAVIFLLLGAFLSRFIGTELFPRADSGNFILLMRGPSGLRLTETEKLAESVEEKMRQLISPHDLSMIVTNMGVDYGFSAAFTPNTGPQDAFFNVELTEDRDHTSQYYASLIRDDFKKDFPNIDFGFQLGGLLSSALNSGRRAPIDIQIEGPKVEQSYEIAREIADKAKNLRGAVDVRVQQRFDTPEISLQVDRTKSAELGLTTDEVIKNVVSAVSGSPSFKNAIWVDPKTGIDYFLGVRFPDLAINTLDDLKRIPITGKDQIRSVPLERLAKLSLIKGASELSHVNLRTVIDVYMDAKGRDIGGLSNDVAAVIKDTNMPKGYSAEIRGEISDMKSSVGSLGGGFVLAALFVYLILVIQFDSFVLPGIIMTTVPLGLVGIVLMLVATKTYFSIQAAIGAIFMIGIAVANGVLLIEFMELRRHSGEDFTEAIISGAKARLRPIMMTALASILGLVPMALGLGKGSEANIPLGRAVIGGQLVSTMLTLFIVPIFYSIIMKGMKINKAVVGAVVTSIFLFVFPVHGGTLTVQQTVELALKNSEAVNARSFSEQASSKDIDVAKSDYLPRVDLEAKDSSGFPGSSGALGIGGLMGSPFESGFGYGVVATENLWDFGRTTHNVGARQQHYYSEKQRTELVRDQVRLDALKAFYVCTGYRALSSSWGSLEKEAEILSREVEKFVKTGQRSIVDRYLVKAQEKEAQTEQAVSEKNLVLEERRLAILTGLQATEVNCPAVSLLDPAQKPNITFDVNDNPVLKEAQFRLEEAKERLAQAKSGNMPRLLVMGSAGAMQDTQLVTSQANYSVAGGIVIPVFEGFQTTREVEEAEATVSQREAELRAARQNMDDLNASIDLRLDSSHEKVTRLLEEYDVVIHGFNMAKSRYFSDVGGLIDLREAFRNLERVESDLISSKIEFLSNLGEKLIVNEQPLNLMEK